MGLTKISGECGRDDCPAIYLTEAGTVIVQGDLLREAVGVTPSQGEALVEIPLSVLKGAVDAVGR